MKRLFYLVAGAGFISPLRFEMDQNGGSYTRKTKLLCNLFFCGLKSLMQALRFLPQKNLSVS